MNYAFFLSLLLSASGDKSYTLDDLEALLKSGGFLEIIEHAVDIRPTERNPRWNQITETAAQRYLDTFPLDKEPLDALVFCENVLLQYPHLKQSRTFMDNRAQVGLKAFPVCFQLGYADRCDQAFYRFVLADAGNQSLAFQAGKLVRRNAKGFVAVPYFEMALREQAGRSNCKDEDVALAVVSGLTLPGKDPEAAAAKKIAFEYCFADLKEKLAAEVGNASKEFLENSCSVLLEKKVLTGLREKKCLRR